MENFKEFFHKYRTPLLIGGGLLVFYLMMRKQQGAPIAMTAPDGGGAAPVVAAPAAVQPEMDTTGQQAAQLQLQAQQQALREQAAASNLALLSAQHQEAFQQAQYAQQLQIGQQQVASAAEAVSFQYRTDRGYNPNARGGIPGIVQNILAPLTQAYAGYARLPGVPLPTGSTPIPGQTNQDRGE